MSKKKSVMNVWTLPMNNNNFINKHILSHNIQKYCYILGARIYLLNALAETFTIHHPNKNSAKAFFLFTNFTLISLNITQLCNFDATSDTKDVLRIARKKIFLP
jgi:hypothetical protein